MTNFSQYLHIYSSVLVQFKNFQLFWFVIIHYECLVLNFMLLYDLTILLNTSVFQFLKSQTIFIHKSIHKKYIWIVPTS